MHVIGLNPGIRKSGAHTWAARMIQLGQVLVAQVWLNHFLHDS